MLESIMTELAERAPVYESYRVDLESCRKEIEKLSADLSNALHERNNAYEQMSLLKGKVSSSEQENSILSQGKLSLAFLLTSSETRDLSRQVQGLLRQIEAIRGGPAGLSSTHGIRALEQASLHRILENGDEGVSMDQNESDSNLLISERLVVFRNIEELQSQNQVLRRTVRNLSKKMEDIEGEQSRQRDEAFSKDMEDASKTIEALQEQLRVQTLKLDTFVRERDQWKKIAESRTQSLSPAKDALSSRAPSPSAEFTRSIEYERMYKELQVRLAFDG